jgi:hypothetical protein
MMPIAAAKKVSRVGSQRLTEAVKRKTKHGEVRSTNIKETTFLEQHAVGEKTLAYYRQVHAAFLRWSTICGLSLLCVTEIDWSATLYLEEMYFEGFPASEASKFLAGIGHLMQELTRGAAELRRAHTAARGFRRLAPSQTRMPLIWAQLVLILYSMVQMGQFECAWATLLTFAGYLRPCETLSLLCSMIVAPQGGRHPHWSIVLHPEEFGVASKTRVYDESLVLDNPEFIVLDSVLHRLLQGRISGLLFSISYRSWATVFQESARANGLEGVVLYQLRHGGATHESYTGFRRGNEIQLRGRWSSAAGPRRYAKPGRVAQLASAMPKQTKEQSEKLTSTMSSWIRGTS